MTTPNPYKQASTGTSLYSTPSSRETIALLGGGEQYQGVTISRDEQAALGAYYEYDLSSIGPDVPPPSPPTPPPSDSTWTEREAYKRALADHERAVARHDPQGQHKFQLKGAQLHMAREASSDGLRVMAWLARFLRPGDDPVQFVAQLAADAGMDTRGDELLGDGERDDDDESP